MENYRHSVNRIQNPSMRNRRSMPAPSCGCGFAGFGAGDECTGLAMAKVKVQLWQNIYPCEKALVRGTIFSELDLPFNARRGCR